MVVAGALEMSNHSPAAADDREYCERYEEMAEPLLAVVVGHDREML